jgi:hypothetical protein
MFKPPLLAAMSLGFLAAACAGPYDRQAPIPVNTSKALTLSERNCLDYGFAADSGPYDRCVQRDSRAREAGRVNRGYAEAHLFEDARNACYDYGVERGTQRYESCVMREVDARRYREQSEISTPRLTYDTDQAPAQMPAPYVGPRAATTGVETFHDEYGFRYDAQGNRVDRYGHIISPQSTRP